MKIRRTLSDWWIVSVEPNELVFASGRRFPYAADIGAISQKRGTIDVWRPAVGGLPRDWGSSVRRVLEGVRQDLITRGEIRDRAAERRAREESKTGSFIVMLSTGETRRFHDSKRAHEWADGQLESRPDIFAAQFFRDRVWTWERGPFQVLSKNEHDRITMDPPPGFQRARSAVEHAAKLEIDRTFTGRKPYTPASPDELAAAWDVAGDAFEEIGLADATLARERADRWWRVAHVSSRRRSSRRKSWRRL